MDQDQNRDLSLVFLIDALGHEIVGRGGFLDRLVGVNRPRVRTILGYSAGAIPSLLTGRLPVEHGHWGMYRRNSASSVFKAYRGRLSWGGRLPRGQWRIRRWLADRLRRDGITGYFSLYEVPLGLLPLFDLCERENIYRPGVFTDTPSLFDRLAEARVPHRVWDWTADPGRAFGEMKAAARDGSERLLFLYTAGLDATMHLEGPRAAAATAWLRVHEERIERIVQAARGAGRPTRLYVFGDHGMAGVKGQIDIMAILRKLPLRIPRDCLAFLDSTMARFWFGGDRARKLVMDRLSGCGAGRFLTKEEMKLHGIDFPKHDYGEEIYLVDPGMLILPSFMGSAPLRGMHGYHPDDPDSHTTLLADPPVEREPESILDLTPLLLRDLGVGGAVR